MNDVQKILMQLREQGWSLSAVGKELNIPANTLRKWFAGLRYPSNAAAVKASLTELTTRVTLTKTHRKPSRSRHGAQSPSKVRQQLSPEVRAGLGLFKDLAPGRSLVDELIIQRRNESLSE